MKVKEKIFRGIKKDDKFEKEKKKVFKTFIKYNFRERNEENIKEAVRDLVLGEEI
jgi:hypothetical protein